MAPEDVNPAGLSAMEPKPAAIRRVARTVAFAATAAVVPAACGAPGYETYVEGYWDNGDVRDAASKTALWDADGNPVDGVQHARLYLMDYELFEPGVGEPADIELEETEV